MSSLYLTLGLICIFLLGVYRAWCDRKILLTRRKKAQIFLNLFCKWVESSGKDSKVYRELLERVDDLQTCMGEFGILPHYQAPFSNVIVPNYLVVLNCVSELAREFTSDNYISNNDIQDCSQLVEYSIIRYGSYLDKLINKEFGKLFNPIRHLLIGLKETLKLPVWMLMTVGIISEQQKDRMISNTIFNIISLIFALVGFVASVIGIILGWDQMVYLVQNWMR